MDLTLIRSHRPRFGQLCLHSLSLLGLWTRLSCGSKWAEQTMWREQTAADDWPVDRHDWMSQGWTPSVANLATSVSFYTTVGTFYLFIYLKWLVTNLAIFSRVFGDFKRLHVKARIIQQSLYSASSECCHKPRPMPKLPIPETNWTETRSELYSTKEQLK